MANFNQTYNYDPIGNIMNKSDQGDYVYSGTGYTNPQAVTQIASSTYAYDNNGNLTNDSTWSHSWDYDNKLASSTNGIITISYQYDQDGNRISKTTGTSTNYYINQFYEIDNGIPVKHIFAGDNKVATVKATTTPVTTYTSTDHLTGTSVETDSTGSPIEVIDYYPFGSVRIDEKTSSQENHYKYTGKELDPETNLYYYGARYYNSDIGRFVGVDPLFNDIGIDNNLFKQKYGKDQVDVFSNPKSLNSYSYVLNNPVIYNDPTGKDWELSISGTALGWSGAIGVRFGMSGANLFVSGGVGAGLEGSPISLSYSPGEISHKTETTYTVGANGAYMIGAGASKSSTNQNDLGQQPTKISVGLGAGADVYLRKEVSIPVVGGEVPDGLELRDTTGGYSTPNYVAAPKKPATSTTVRSASPTTTNGSATPKSVPQIYSGQNSNPYAKKNKQP